jgi:hypothetical protein
MPHQQEEGKVLNYRQIIGYTLVAELTPDLVELGLGADCGLH